PAVAESAPAVRPNANSHVYTCIAIGPFATPLDMRNARTALSTQAVRMRSRQEQTTQSRGWWVYLPASSSRDQALAQARRLSAANIKDYFVVGAGDQPNTVSLGLFKDPANARKRRDEIVAAGFPAQMSERTETVPEYWLDLAVADNAHFDWRSRVRVQGLGSHSTGCF
ncbi:MAG TPA: SPOR domain-containing protein, partial [Dyella sp.]|uniref:SPOR domain-containing protein n=1 Tax=Dyella sp. TaxID=1869338 RepID=UPI002F95C241